MDGIVVKDLSVRRAEHTVVHDVSFSLPEGSITALSGRSGCGKSTLLLALQGLLDEKEAAVSGEIRVGGREIRQMADDIPYLSASGFLMQNVDAQIVNLLSEDELVFGMENRGVPTEEMRRRVREYVEAYGLFPDKPVEQLSGGQKQRLLLASILITGHRVLLLDEPFANLDAEGAAMLGQVLSKLRADGATILVVEHRLELIAPLADRLLWMENGSLRELCGEEIPTFTAQKAGILEVDLGWNGAPGETLLSLRGLNARRGKTEVLRSLELSLASDTATLLLVRNGSGKTTLLRLLCGLAGRREFAAQDFFYDGENVRGQMAYRGLRRRVGFVFQNPAHQLFMKSVRQELQIRSGSVKDADEMLELFGICHLADRHPYTLSQGEKRLVSVAAVAASGAKLLLLDEPTIGQDYESLLHMATALRELQKCRGTAFLISTHDMQAARLFGGRAISLKGGGNDRIPRSGLRAGHLA